MFKNFQSLSSFSKKFFWHLLVGTGILFASSLHAAPLPGVSNSVLNSVDAGLLSEQMSLPQASTLKTAQPVKPTIQEEAPVSIPNADKITLVLENVTFLGNTVFSPQELQEIFEPFFGKSVTLADVLQQVKRVTQKYREAGYFLSKAIFPPQSIQDGKITIQIVEGYINHVTVQDFPEKQKELLEKYAQSIMDTKPLKYSDLERYLLLINDLTGLHIQSIVAADSTTPGASHLTLLGKYTPVNASLSYDNYGSHYIGPRKATATTSFNSLLAPGGTLSLRYVTAQHIDELQFFEAKHDQALGTDGLHWGLGASHTYTHPQFTLAQYNIKSTSQNVFTNLSYPIIRSRQETLISDITFNYMNVYSSTFGKEMYDDPIRDVALGGTYENFVWNGINTTDAHIYQGLDVMGATKQGPKSRAGAKSNFHKYTLSFSRNQFFNDVFSLFVMASSQYTQDTMFSAETFSFGGVNIGRGYDPAQFTGDKGISGKVEFRILTKPGTDVFEKVSYYAFYDEGTVWNLNKQTLRGRQSGASTGLGVRSLITSHFNFDVFIAKPLTAPNASQKLMGKNGNAPLFYFQISTTW